MGKPTKEGTIAGTAPGNYQLIPQSRCDGRDASSVKLRCVVLIKYFSMMC